MADEMANGQQQPSNNQWEVDSVTPASGQNPTQEAAQQSSPSQSQGGGQWEVDSVTPPDDGKNTITGKEGLLAHAGDTSGLAGLATLISSAGAHRIAMYHKAVDAFKKGDIKQASIHAYGAMSGGDKDDPLRQAAAQILQMPWEEAKQAYAESKAAINGPDKVAHGLQAAEHLVGAVPVLGAGAQSVGGEIDKDAHEGNYAGLLGDVAGFVSTLGLGSEMEEAGAAGKTANAASKGGETAEASKGMRPTTTPIAGVDVPVSPAQMKEQSFGTKVAKKAATKEGAQKFINETVQPAAQRASQSNFTQAALKTVNQLKQLRGEQPAMLPNLHSVDDIAKYMEDAAHPTYDKLDALSAKDHTDWELRKAQAEHAATASEPAGGRDFSTIQEGDAKATPEFNEPEPKLFTELQTQIRNAESTLLDRQASTVEKAKAAKDLPEFRQQMDDFVKQHKGEVDPKELDAADLSYKQAQRYKWISNKIRVGTTGTEGTASDLLQKPTMLNPSTLERLPAQFDNHFKEPGAFNRMLGRDGIRNYNDVLNVLRNPIQRSSLEEWIRKAVVGGAGAAVGAVTAGPLGATAGSAGAIAGKYGLSRIADQLLFNPELGQATLKRWKAATAAATRLHNDESGNFVVPGTGTNNPWGNLKFDRAAMDQARSELGDSAPTSELLNRAQAIKSKLMTDGSPVTNNASGESAASQEAINRSTSEKAKGIKRYRIDTRSGKEIPLSGPDAVDAAAGPHEIIVQRGLDGDVEMDRGRLARPTGKSRAMRNVYAGAQTALAGR